MTDFTLLYLHGFLSSPQSSKARQALAHAAKLGLADNMLIPFLQEGPQATIDSLEQQLEGREKIAIIGSSLGGFYASVLAERFRAPAVLINPAIDPWKYWPDHIGEHRNYHTGQIHEVTQQHVEELRRLSPASIADAENYLVFLQRHDEVLDATVALSRFGEERCVVRENGDHAYTGFDLELPAAFDFLLSRIDANVR